MEFSFRGGKHLYSSQNLSAINHRSQELSSHKNRSNAYQRLYLDVLWKKKNKISNEFFYEKAQLKSEKRKKSEFLEHTIELERNLNKSNTLSYSSPLGHRIYDQSMARLEKKKYKKLRLLLFF